jgi:hypothetical protein
MLVTPMKLIRTIGLTGGSHSLATAKRTCSSARRRIHLITLAAWFFGNTAAINCSGAIAYWRLIYLRSAIQAVNRYEDR